MVSGVPYGVYFEGAQFVHFLLGPATVALAIPLYQQVNELKRSGPALVLGIVLGSLTAAGAAVGVRLAGRRQRGNTAVSRPEVRDPAHRHGDRAGTRRLAVAHRRAGDSHRITGAVLGPLVLNLLKINDWRARGLALGVAAHGLATARALQVNAIAGAFAGIAMGLNGLATAILLPLIFALAF